MNKFKVVYACDTVGDHKAQFVKLIDTDSRSFETAEAALLFGRECTECLNLQTLVNQLSKDAVDILLSSTDEELLLNDAEFDHYSEY